MIEQLLAYQKVDRDLKEIEKTLAESVERKKAVSAKKYLDGVVENVNKLDDRASELISAYEQATQEKLKLKEQEEELIRSIEDATDENAVNFLLKKAEELMSKIKALGKKATMIEGEIQAVLKEYGTIKNTSKAAQTQYAEFGAKYNDLKKSFKEKKEKVEGELETLKGQVDSSLMQLYLKKRGEKMYPIVYEVKADVCGYCNMGLYAADVNKLKKGEVVECSNCGRLLYKK